MPRIYDITRDDQRQIGHWLGAHGNIRLELLYSASTDGCNGPAFHAKCDHQGPTVSVGFTTDGWAYGGFSSLSFDSSSDAWKADPKSFLFRLRRESRIDYLRCLGEGGSVYCGADSGPTFGSPSAIEVQFFSASHDKDGDCFDVSSCEIATGEAFKCQNLGASDLAGACRKFYDIRVYKVIEYSLYDIGREWRKVAWNWDAQTLEELREDVSTCQPPEALEISKTNILLIGQVGAGKSSFCNTVNSLCRGFVTAKAVVGSEESSVTTVFRRYEFSDRIGGESMHFRLCDTMGLEENQDLEAINFAQLLDGNIRDRAPFNPSIPLDQNSMAYNTSPTLEDKAHIVVFVVDGNNAGVLSQLMINKLNAVKTLVKQRGIPLMMLMTKVDKIDPLVSEDLTNTYRSVEVYDTMQQLSTTTGIPMTFIMPVKSYDREIELENAIDILALAALQRMLRLADGYFENEMELRDIS